MSAPQLILVCGGRDFADGGLVRSVLQEYLPDHPIGDENANPPTVLQGGARGADTLARREGLELGFWVQTYPADWEVYGNRAGVLRNLQMLDRRPDLVLAFPGGRGTAHTVAEAERRGIPVRQVTPARTGPSNPKGDSGPGAGGR